MNIWDIVLFVLIGGVGWIMISAARGGKHKNDKASKQEPEEEEEEVEDVSYDDDYTPTLETVIDVIEKTDKTAASVLRLGLNHAIEQGSDEAFRQECLETYLRLCTNASEPVLPDRLRRVDE